MSADTIRDGLSDDGITLGNQCYFRIFSPCILELTDS
jgi:hypothetical protein